MNRPAHSPGPIASDEQEHDEPYQDIRINGADGRTICTVWIDDAPVRDFNELQYANARRIVLSWNAHDDLVAGLEGLLHALHDLYPEGMPFPLKDRATEALTALDKAGVA